MLFLIIWAFVNLVHLDLYLARGNFRALHELVRTCRVKNALAHANAVREICEAVDMACIWYWKEVLCLQRSAVTACLLKRAGIRAELVIGAQQLPFKAHAWVEVGGQVVNDKAYIKDVYSVLDRC
jgi:hypothetical protein